MEKRYTISDLICNFADMNEFFDKDLGSVIVKRNHRAKRVIVRRKADTVEITVPMHLSKKEIKKHFETLKPQILTLPKRETVNITEQSTFKTLTFDVAITPKSIHTNKVVMSLKNGILTIDTPSQYDIKNDNIQLAIKRSLIHALRHEAKRVLPNKVITFANKLNLSVAEVKINSSKGRWGSCSNKKNINLSLFLLMLPEHLIDYVILHELAHTIEMNHSAKFWQLLDTFCDGKARELDDECKNRKDEYLGAFI